MKVALYARVSSEAQDVSLSISAQCKALREYAEKNGHVIIREFVDEAETGTSTSRRPGFKEMIAVARDPSRPIEAIIIWKYSRFARNRSDSIVYKTLLRKNNVQVISITEPAENSPTGRLMEAIIKSMDEFYSDNLGEEVTRGMRESATRGFYLSGRTPYGYKKVRVQDGNKWRTKLETEPEQSHVVQTVFNNILQGKGLTQIVQELNKQGVSGPKGRSWSKTGLYAILTNEIYTGTFVWGRNSKRGHSPVRTENACPALVDLQTFELVQKLMENRAPAKQHPRRTQSRFLLSGLAFCGDCGKAMVAQDAKSGKFSYYVCGTLNKKGAGSCGAPYLNAHKFEAQVISRIKDYILTPETLTSLAEMVHEELDKSNAEAKKELVLINGELGEVNRRLGNLYDAIEQGNIDYSLLKPRLQELKEQHDRLSCRKAEIESGLGLRSVELPSPEILIRYVEDLRYWLEQRSLAETRTFIKSFVQKIVVDRETAKITYTFPGLPGDNGEDKETVLSTVQYGGR